MNDRSCSLGHEIARFTIVLRINLSYKLTIDASDEVAKDERSGDDLHDDCDQQ